MSSESTENRETGVSGCDVCASRSECEGITFDRLFNMDEIQRLQDQFADATGVASIITQPDGTPITRPSNFCRLCKDIIRKTERGRINCYRSDSIIGKTNPDGPVIQRCMSGGLYDAGAGISVGGRHIANWLIGQVRDEGHTEDTMREYAREIGADEDEMIEAFREVTCMSFQQFQKIASMLFTLTNQLSKSAYDNLHKSRYIIESKRAEEERLKAHKMRSIGVLAGGIAHDFNNILTGLFGNIELARMELPLDHASRAYLETTTEALNRARNLTRQLLTFAPGGAPLLEEFCISDTIRKALHRDLSGRKVCMNIPADIRRAMADAELIALAISNLIANAIEAMPEGGTLSITAENIPPAKSAEVKLTGWFIKLMFRDEGCGIEKKLFEKIFDPYFSTKQNGRGLGLAIAYSIMSRHSGRITVESTLGKGSTFSLYVPAVNDRLKPMPANNDGESDATASHPCGHILLMDDEEIIRNVAGAMLAAIGCTVECASDGDEAIELYGRAIADGTPFDVVITDLTVPGGKGGRQTLEHLLTIDPGVKAIVTSGYSNDPILAHYQDCGFKGRLAKPFRLKELKTEIMRVMAL